MTCSERVSQWTAMVSSQLPHLSRPQAQVLALWSLGMVLAHSCGLSQVSALLALLLGQAEGTLRQRLREWYSPAKDKAGHHRCSLEVATCFAPLLRWVLAWWPEESHEMALALDATTLGQRFTVLCISVLVGGCAIPVAWKVLVYNQKGFWQPYWLALLRQREGVIPSDWHVLVLADRGLYAPWLYRQIVAQGWHPFLRINVGTKARLVDSDRWEWITHWLPARGEQWAQRVHCFADKSNRLECTLLICREPGYEEAWVIVTDLPPDQVHGAWYRLRAWIEIVQSQLTKPHMFTALGGGDHIADLHLLVSHDDAIDEQFDELAFLLKGSLSQSLLHTLTKDFDGLHHFSQLMVALGVYLQLTSLRSNRLQSLFQVVSSTLVLV